MQQVSKRRPLSFCAAFVGCGKALTVEGSFTADATCLVQKTCGGGINLM